MRIIVHTGARFVRNLLVLTAFLSIILFIISLNEHLQRLSWSQTPAGFSTAALLAGLSLPTNLLESLPLGSLFASLFVFLGMARHGEIAAVRAAGISVWHILLPLSGIVLGTGVLLVGVLDPIAAAFEKRIASTARFPTAVTKNTSAGIWVRQEGIASDWTIHVRSAGVHMDRFQEGVFFQTDKNGRFLQRLQAGRIVLHDNTWVLQDPVRTDSRARQQTARVVTIETPLTSQRLRQSSAPAQQLPLWSLPRTIALLDSTGISSISYRLHLHKRLSIPFVMATMVIIAAIFALRLHSRINPSLIVGLCILFGILVQIFSYFVASTALHQDLPPSLAAWAPCLLNLLLGVAFVAHWEDG